MNTVDQLKTSAGNIKRLRPFYSDILEFYTRVFEAREKSKPDISPAPVMMEQALLDLKKDNDMPLIDPARFKVDTDSATTLLITICDLAQEYAPNLATDAGRIQSAVKTCELDPNLLFRAILENMESVLNDISKTIHVPVPQLILFGTNSMAPSIAACAQQLEAYLEEDHKHMHGYCPICGSRPDLAILDEDGKRHLKCNLCSHQWMTKRMGCVFCDSSDPDKQQYFYTDDEKEYRVNLCDNCKNYIKVVDLRQMNRYFYPGLEVVATLHLDMKAEEKGYVGIV